MRILSKVIIALVFILAGILFFHNLTSINADMGRHIKLGEIMWQTGEIPKTNLLSYTAPDFPFINHHWLSEVIFYGVYSLGGNWIAGLKSVIIFKVGILLVVYFLLFLVVRRHNIFSIGLSFLVSIFVFSARTEPRPEIFSYLIFSAYLFIIYKVRENRISNLEFRISNRLFDNLIFKLRNCKIYSKLNIRNYKFQLSWLWILPVLQLLWVNLHIYFIIGPIIYFLFLIEKAMLNKINRQDLSIGLLVILINFANPNFIDGALYPLKVLSNYGYSVAENSSLFFLAKYFGHWAPQDKLFLISLFVLGGSFVVNFWRNKSMNKLPTSTEILGRATHHPETSPGQVGITDLRSPKIKTSIFNLLLIAVMAILSFKMQRNIPLFALSLWPIMSENLTDLASGLTKSILPRLRNFLLMGVVFLLVGSIYLVVSGWFYNYIDSAKMFGLGVSNAAQSGTDFVRDNKIHGPVFNNFDIGSYLAWQLYPDQKVFVDGRPEAYPIVFFEDIYKPMQKDEKVWQDMSGQYGINYIFFTHTDITEWADEFLTRISKDKGWPMVFLNDVVVVFLKDNNINRSIIGKYQITSQNVENKIPLVLAKLSKKDSNAFVNFGNALYRFRWLDASAKVYEVLIANQPDNPYGYQGAAYAYVTMNSLATQEKAAQNLEKAIGLGLKTFNNYFTLGIIKANLNNLFVAEENIKKALEINPGNQNAKQVLEVIKEKQRVNYHLL